MNSGLREKGTTKAAREHAAKVTGALACNGLTLDSDERQLAGGVSSARRYSSSRCTEAGSRLLVV
jgi:hypothetical protein